MRRFLSRRSVVGTHSSSTKPRGFLGSGSGGDSVRASAGRSGTGSQFASGVGASTLANQSVRRSAMWLSSVFMLTIAIAGGLIYLKTKQSSRELAEGNLQSILSANVSAVELWLLDQENAAARMLAMRSEDNTLQRWIRATAESDSPAGADISVAEIRKHFDEQVSGIQQAGGCLGWIIVDDRSKILLASDERWIGQDFQSLRSSLDACYRDGRTVSPALWLPHGESSFEASDRVNDPKNADQAAMIAMAPIRDGIVPVGAFGLLLDPADRFTELLSVARTGQSGETYAFNSDGVMISRSRFEDQLEEIGLLGGDTPQGSILRIGVRDPGVLLLAADDKTRRQTLVKLEDLPPTLMIASATEGQAGSDVEGYNDYRGVPVIGAWRWLDDHGFGIASEIDVQEAYRPIGILQTSMWWLFGFLAMTSAGLAGVSFVVGRLYNKAMAIQGRVRRLGRYEIFEIIGRGGMGTVYRGRHELLTRDVAIKVLEIVDDNDQIVPLADERAIERFEREVQLTSALRHPNTIAVYDFGRTEDRVFFYVMEHIAGINLRKMVKQYGAQSPARVIHLLTQVCGSIAEAHDHGLIHRDIKPGNIVVTNFAGMHDMVKVLDFGLVRSLESNEHTLTTHSALTGTPMYMAPETIRDSNRAGPLSDIYAIGAVGYQLLTGKPPYQAKSAAEICGLRLGGDPMRPSKRLGKSLPDDLQNILMSCLREDPAQRVATATELAESLQSCQDSLGWTESAASTWWQNNAPAGVVPPITLKSFAQDADSADDATTAGAVTEANTDVTMAFDPQIHSADLPADLDLDDRKLT